MANSLTTMPISIYSIDVQSDAIISKGRARIFYTGQNRNGTYITDEFADKLLSTVSYTPVKGIWNTETQDFADHGSARTEGRIYGVVPENYNLSWEAHLDEDGIERNYACVDVLLYTAIYPEAAQIVGKSLSMELHPPTIRGSWEYVNGVKLYKYSEASFLGLQALGDEVEPCFEGAGFYTLLKSLKSLGEAFEQYQLKTQGGKKEMPQINFKLSDREKYDLIWQALNSEYTEENDWCVSVQVCDIYDEYALCYDFESKEYFRQDYQKDENGITLGEKKKCYMLDISEEEYTALQNIRAAHENSYVKAEEDYTHAEEVLSETTEKVTSMTAANAEAEETISGLNSKVEEMTVAAEELNTQIASLQADIQTKDAAITDMTATVESLNAYKYQVETSKKQAIINKYSVKLDESIIDSYTAKLDEYTAETLDKDLAYEIVKASPDIFSLGTQADVLPKDEPLTGIEAILSKYKN